MLFDFVEGFEIGYGQHEFEVQTEKWVWKKVEKVPFGK
jgi:hypothetical protein